MKHSGEDYQKTTIQWFKDQIAFFNNRKSGAFIVKHFKVFIKDKVIIPITKIGSFTIICLINI